MPDETKTPAGDQFHIKGSVVGSAVGRGARLTAGQIIANVTQAADQSSDADLAAAVKRALEAIGNAPLPEADKAEAADTVGKTQEEVANPDADAARPGRVKRWLTALADVCEPASDAIRAAKAII